MKSAKSVAEVPLIILQGYILMKKHHKTMVITMTVAVFVSAIYFVILYHNIYKIPDTLQKEEIFPVFSVDQKITLSVNSNIWDGIKPVTVPLFPQSARTAFGKYERKINVRGIYNKEDIAFLIEYEDETENRMGLETPDYCAILFVPANSPASAQMMGFESIANIWRWSALRDVKKIAVVREFAAHGPTTQKPMENQNVLGQGIYSKGRWKVLFIRKRVKQQKDDFEFMPTKKFKIAFAVWDGEKLETFSRKSISILRALTLE